MDSPISAKRRKLNNSTSTLTKPFKSPLRATRPDGTPLKTQRAPQYMPSALARSVNSTNDDSSKTEDPPDASRSYARPQPLATPSRRPHTTSLLSNSSTKQPPLEPDEAAVQKQCSALERQIRTIRAEIDTLKRATTIIEKDSNAGLLELGEKWQKAAQGAADALFETAKERVADMGGVKAWKKSQTQAAVERDFAFGDPFDGQEGDHVDDEDESETLSQEAKVKRRMLAAESQRSVVEEEDELSFTMGMMLGSMNIELDLIGFDKQKDGWV